jgi:hypothetical protein
MAAVEPLPLVPAMWTVGTRFWGSPMAVQQLRYPLQPGTEPSQDTLWMNASASSIVT